MEEETRKQVYEDGDKVFDWDNWFIQDRTLIYQYLYTLVDTSSIYFSHDVVRYPER